MNDVIERQAAIDAVKRLSLGETDATRLAMRIGDYLERLPAANVARDIVTIIENEKDMRVITDNNLWYQRGYEDGFREGRTRKELIDALENEEKKWQVLI